MSLREITLETDKTLPVYAEPLRIRQGDKGDELSVILGKSFVTLNKEEKTPVQFFAERFDQTLVQVKTELAAGSNTFTITFPDAMYATVGVFRRVYFKIGDDSTSDIKIEVLSGTGSSSANGNYIQDFEELLTRAMSYVYTLNSLAGNYDAIIDNKIKELIQKMTDFVNQAQEDLDKLKKAYADSQTQAETDAKAQRDGFDTEFNKLIDSDKETFKGITTEFNSAVDAAKAQNTSNQQTFEDAETKRTNDFKSQSDGFDTEYGKQNVDFETRFKAYLDKLQSDYDSFKLALTTDVSDLNKQLKKVGTDVSELDAKADEIAASLQDVDLSQMATNKADIDKLKVKFDDYTTTADLNTLLKNYVLTTALETTLKSYPTTDAMTTKLADTLAQAKSNTSEAIKNLVGAAPETLDTISELAEAVTGNKTLVDVIDKSITQKADKTYVDEKLDVPTMTQAEYGAAKTAGTLENRFYIVNDDTEVAE